MKYFEPLPPEVEKVATAVVDATYKIHRALGPGLIESVYEKCLIHELGKRHFEVRYQFDLPVAYDDIVIDSGLRPDLLIADVLIVEVKSSRANASSLSGATYDLPQANEKEVGSSH
jgi:hypothetical protein